MYVIQVYFVAKADVPMTMLEAFRKRPAAVKQLYSVARNDLQVIYFLR